MANAIAVYSGFGSYKGYRKGRSKKSGHRLPRRTKKAVAARKRFAAKVRGCARKFHRARKPGSWRRYLKKCLRVGRSRRTRRSRR